MWAAPTWPVKLCFFIGMFLLAVQTVSEILKQVIGLVEVIRERKGKEAM